MTRIYEKKLYPKPERDPIIDVIEQRDAVRVVVALPGIREEDVRLDTREGFLVVEVTKYGQAFRKAASLRPSKRRLAEKSYTLRNSVLEIVLEKTSEA